MPVYTYTQLKKDVQDIAHGTLGNLKQERSLINRSVREVVREVDLRSTKRKAQLSPAIFRNVNQYGKPTDLKGLGLIDVKPRYNRNESWRGEAILTTPEEFDRMKRSFRNVMAIQDHDFVGKLLISKIVDDAKITLHELDTVSGNGTVAVVVGSAATNLTADPNDFINGSGSINFDSDTSGTEISVDISDPVTVDLTNYEGEQIFSWLKIPLTDPSLISNIQLRWGSSDTDYYQRQITTNNEATAFEKGWNLLRFDWDENVTKAGSPDIEDIKYHKLIINLSAATAVTDWNWDFLVARRGQIHDVIYYSKYPWQSSTGSWIENSTADSDLLNADTDEVDLIATRVDYNIAKSTRDVKMIKMYKDDYDEAKTNYQLKYPSEAKALTTTYTEYDSLDENVDLDEIRDTT